MFPSKRFSKAGEEILIAFFSFSFKVNAHPVHGFSKLTSLAYTVLEGGGSTGHISTHFHMLPHTVYNGP